jgi:hypothetical protein
MVSHTEQNSTNPWIGWVFSLTQPNPGYGQSQQTETANPTNSWVGGLLLIVLTISRVRIG